MYILYHRFQTTFSLSLFLALFFAVNSCLVREETKSVRIKRDVSSNALDSVFFLKKFFLSIPAFCFFVIFLGSPKLFENSLSDPTTSSRFLHV
jgi:hypothetical protein